MEEQEHNTHLSATPTSADQLGFPQASIDIERIEVEKERVDDATHAMTAPSIPSRREPAKLDYVRRLPRVQRDQYALLYGRGLQCKRTTSEGPAPTQTANLQAHPTTASLHTDNSSMKPSSLLHTDADVPPLKRSCRIRVETWKVREARETREATARQHGRGKRGKPE
jgi:hypothetical protein